MAKRTEKKKLKLNDITGTKGNNDEIQKRIRQQVSQNIFFDHRQHVLVFHALAVFNLGKLKYNIGGLTSIENACLKILQLGGIYECNVAAPIFKRKDDGGRYDPIKHFVLWIILVHPICNKFIEDGRKRNTLSA